MKSLSETEAAFRCFKSTRQKTEEICELGGPNCLEEREKREKREKLREEALTLTWMPKVRCTESWSGGDGVRRGVMLLTYRSGGGDATQCQVGSFWLQGNDD